MSVYFPEATKSLGNTAVVVVQTMADMDTPDLSGELSAGTSVAAQCFLYNRFAVTGETNKGVSPQRICEATEREEFGRTRYSVADIQYVHNPQENDAHADNALRAALAVDSEVYIVERQGLDSRTDALTAGELVNVYHVRCGPQNRGVTGDGEFDEFSITQSLSLIEDPVYDVAIVA